MTRRERIEELKRQIEEQEGYLDRLDYVDVVESVWRSTDDHISNLKRQLAALEAEVSDE